MSIPRVALTPGEPAGIGPDLIIALAQTACPAELVAVADPILLAERALQLGLPLTLLDWQPGQPAHAHIAGTLPVLAVFAAVPVVAGTLDIRNADYVLETLRRACDGCLRGDFAAVVTAPVQKSVINEAGHPFTGHTEFLQERCGVDRVVMMLACPGLRVALVTTHLPLRAVADAITPALLTEVIDILHHDLVEKFGIAKPRILVTGLNPHAGEGGHLGHEEIDVIIPTLEGLRRERGYELQGPLPADTLFVPKYLEQADAVLAMFHDQGLPVLKHMSFGHGVNITLGLPIIRTSVDHGTALDLAGTGRADVGSLRAALDTALALASRNTSQPKAPKQNPL